MAETWSERMNRFWSISKGAEGYGFSADEIESVANSAEFENLRRGASGPQRARYEAVGTLQPERKKTLP